jgi:hypothetical protein
MELASCLFSGTYNIEVAPTFLVHLWAHYTQLHRVTCDPSIKDVSTMARLGSIV